MSRFLMYARGMTVCEIQGFVLDQYRVEVSADFISTIAVDMEALAELASAAQRPCDLISTLYE